MLTHGDRNNMKNWFVKSYWMQEQRVAYLEIIGDFDVEGVIDFNHFWTDNYLAVGDAPVHTIIDASGLTGYPTDLIGLREGTSISVNHPNIGWVILVGFTSNPILKFLSSAVSQVLNVKFKQVESLQAAKDILVRIDDSVSQEVL